MTPDDGVLRVIGEIYDAVDEPSRWELCLRSICGLLSSDAASLFCIDHSRPHASIVVTGSVPAKREGPKRSLRDRPRRTRDRLSHFTDPPSGLLGPADSLPDDNPTAFITQDATSDYRLLARFDEQASVTAGVLAIERVVPSVGFAASDSATLALVLPHLRRALSLHRRFVELRSKAETLTSVIEDFRAGVLLVRDDHFVVHANRAATAALQRRDGLINRGGYVRASNAATALQLANAVENASRLSISDPARPCFLSIPRAGRRALHVMVSPVYGSTAGARPGATVVLWISDPEAALPIKPEHLKAAFGLNPTECRVAIALADGKSIDEIGMAFRLTTETSRWYVKQILGKTNTSSQARAVRAIIASIP